MIVVYLHDFMQSQRILRSKDSHEKCYVRTSEEINHLLFNDKSSFYVIFCKIILMGNSKVAMKKTKSCIMLTRGFSSLLFEVNCFK